MPAMTPIPNRKTMIATAAMKMNAAKFNAKLTMGDMSNPSPKRRCGACQRRRAKLRKFLQRFKKGSKK